ncbi:MAG: dioxygenase [Emcibacteraceae bacterium]|nr:dioxygenase [Emcibacteraceae bacterium]
MKNKTPPFHYSFKMKDHVSTRDFYGRVLGCVEGRSNETWLDFDFFGHQITAHLSDNFPELDYCGLVDGIAVPIPHFGVVLPLPEYLKVKEALIENNYPFVVKPYIRYEGKREEQHSLFIIDPSGNPLEFKSYSGVDEDFI